MFLCPSFLCRVLALFGGVDQKEQILALRQGCEIVITTPGRLVHFFKKKHLKSTRITYLVLDEADRMFDMGFEPQVRSIIGQIRPDRQSELKKHGILNLFLKKN